MEANLLREAKALMEDDVVQAKLVLIGIGKEFAAVSENSSQIIRAYGRLRELLQGKNYFIVSLCMDDLIYEAGLDEERIVTPCGGQRFLQCEKACGAELIRTEELPEDVRERMGKGEFPHCEKCGAPMVYNNILAEQYVEAGYLPQWDRYRKWLTGTVNQNLCVLELGVGMEFPSMIRWPFEKIVYLNEKARMYRIHSKLYQLTEEIRNRAVAVRMSPVDFLCDEDLWEKGN